MLKKIKEIIFNPWPTYEWYADQLQMQYVGNQHQKIIAIFMLNEPTHPEINFSIIFGYFDDEIMVEMVKLIVNFQQVIKNLFL